MNKNTKALRKLVRAAGKAGMSEITVNVPVKDWHNHPKPSFTTITVPCARRAKDGVISTSGERRNMKMVTLHNVDNKGKKYSLTAHEPIHPQVPVTHPNHAYMAKEKRYHQKAA